MSGGGAMNKQRDNKGFWNRYAKLYDFEINRFSGKAYAEMTVRGRYTKHYKCEDMPHYIFSVRKSDRWAVSL